MPKPEIKYICQSCGYESPRWVGKCPECEQWNSLTEEQVQAASQMKVRQIVTSSKPRSITELSFSPEERRSTGIGELDRVLGGGIVAGSAVLVGGAPGIGKSTLMLQAANSLSKTEKVLYVSGEESAKQIRLRAERLGTLSAGLQVLPENNIFAIEQSMLEVKPMFVVIDSIQTMYREDIPSAPGSVSQVRECASYLVRLAKSSGIPVFFVGHVTKEGNIAGPRVLEHIVDTVLYFEGDTHRQYRILRAVKNRFGSTNEVGIFEMKEAGLIEVKNPSKLFLEEKSDAAGSVITVSIEGSRPLLVEIQALVSHSNTAIPRRSANGFDYNRALMLVAVIDRRLGIRLSDKDVYVNVAGGIELNEPAADLPVAMSIVSCYKDKNISSDIVFIGEVGLAGEVRAVNQIEGRITEASKLGFKSAVIPKGNMLEISKAKGIKIVPVSHVREAMGSIQ
ncbi:MAG: DNA repair protein RadA [bacterium]